MTHPFLTRLQVALAQPLPGQAAQFKLAHTVRQQFPPPTADARRAGVLALFYPNDRQVYGRNNVNLIFIQRSSREPRDRHAGQISFPGGSLEAHDANLAATAIRETEEEIGVPAAAIELVGPLTELFIPVSNFLVSPYVGFTAARPDFILQPTEVDAVLEVPFADFLQPTARQLMDKRLGNGITLKDTPYWAVGGHEIWGATAMITSEIVELLRG
ncbi:MAG: CoA pyrophosphatase [Bacteroidota bacterium]